MGWTPRHFAAVEPRVRDRRPFIRPCPRCSPEGIGFIAWYPPGVGRPRATRLDPRLHRCGARGIAESDRHRLAPATSEHDPPRSRYLGGRAPRGKRPRSLHPSHFRRVRPAGRGGPEGIRGRSRGRLPVTSARSRRRCASRSPPVRRRSRRARPPRRNGTVADRTSRRTPRPDSPRHGRASCRRSVARGRDLQIRMSATPGAPLTPRPRCTRAARRPVRRARLATSDRPATPTVRPRVPRSPGARSPPERSWGREGRAPCPCR